jgi:pSer/pThr/pTyr-binding forkhead associated (FHA) protein
MPSVARAKLVCESGSDSGKTFYVWEEETLIGRGDNATIPLGSPKISRRHARLIFDGTRFYLEDLGSTNGTFLNDNRILSRTPLDWGSTIRLGNETKIRFYAAQ